MLYRLSTAINISSCLILYLSLYVTNTKHFYRLRFCDEKKDKLPSNLFLCDENY